MNTPKLTAVGKDKLIHCVSVSDKSVSVCSKKISVTQVNPDFKKLPFRPVWCYECSHILEVEDEELAKYRQETIDNNINTM